MLYKKLQILREKFKLQVFEGNWMTIKNAQNEFLTFYNQRQAQEYANKNVLRRMSYRIIKELDEVVFTKTDKDSFDCYH